MEGMLEEGEEAANDEVPIASTSTANATQANEAKQVKDAMLTKLSQATTVPAERDGRELAAEDQEKASPNRSARKRVCLGSETNSMNSTDFLPSHGDKLHQNTSHEPIIPCTSQHTCMETVGDILAHQGSEDGPPQRVAEESTSITVDQHGQSKLGREWPQHQEQWQQQEESQQPHLAEKKTFHRSRQSPQEISWLGQPGGLYSPAYQHKMHYLSQTQELHIFDVDDALDVLDSHARWLLPLSLLRRVVFTNIRMDVLPALNMLIKEATTVTRIDMHDCIYIYIYIYASLNA